mgnify:CR=1
MLFIFNFLLSEFKSPNIRFKSLLFLKNSSNFCILSISGILNLLHCSEASEQCNRLSIPEIDKIQKLDEFFKNNKDLNLIFGDLNSDNKKLKINNKKLLCILIGPEGDYTEVEREKILKYCGTQSIKLGNNILRTETAVISALSVINFLKN